MKDKRNFQGDGVVFIWRVSFFIVSSADEGGKRVVINLCGKKLATKNMHDEMDGRNSMGVAKRLSPWFVSTASSQPFS